MSGLFSAANPGGNGERQVNFTPTWPADFNADAVVNCDGGIDGTDIEVFFPAWEAGGC